MAEEPNRQAVLTTLTTEHFTLQGARSQTVGESAVRSSLYRRRAPAARWAAVGDRRALLDEPLGTILELIDLPQ
jgi:hypothetical protein